MFNTNASDRYDNHEDMLKLKVQYKINKQYKDIGKFNAMIDPHKRNQLLK